MTKSIMQFTKGVVAGVVVGATVSMVMQSCSKPKKKNNGNIIKNLGAFVSQFNGMMK